MAVPRLSKDEQLRLAVDELVWLGSVVDGLGVEVAGPDQVRLCYDGTGWPAKVIAYEAVGDALAAQLVATAARGHTVVVANRISEPARRLLGSRRWSWVDRRIGAHVAFGRRDVEVRFCERRFVNGVTATGDESGVSALSRPAGDGPIRGRAGVAYAAALLCSPNSPPSFRSVAAAVHMSPTAISNAVKHLAAGGLVGPANRATLPELFWALAEVWNPVKVVAVGSVPDPSRSEAATAVDRLDDPGWVLGGDLAAVELGAPVFTAESRPWLWVPSLVEARRAERTYGRVAWPDRAAVIAVAPTALVCQRRRPPARPGEWPLPHPVFAALELARDPGRGREILARWTPEGVDDVWH